MTFPDGTEKSAFLHDLAAIYLTVLFVCFRITFHLGIISIKEDESN